MVHGSSESRRDSSPFTILKSKFRLTNPDPSPDALPPSPHRSRQWRPRHASVDSPSQHTRPPYYPLTQAGQSEAYVPRSDGDGTVASQFRFLQNHEEQRATRRSRRATVPVPPRHVSADDPLSSSVSTGDLKAQQLSRLIQEISGDPQGYAHAPVPGLRVPKRKRRASVPILPLPDEGQTRAPPTLVFEALGRIPHVGGREAVDRVLDLHEWMMIHQLDSMDQEERDAVRAQESEDDEIAAGLEGQSSSSTRSASSNSPNRRDHTRKTVFGVALRYISIYASTSVLLSSSASTSVATPSSPSTPYRPVEGHTLSLPILLVSTIEELYRTGLYTASLFRLLPSPLRLRELVQVFDSHTLPKSVIVTPRPKARERGLSTRFGGSVSLHLEGVGEVGSVVSTWLGALPGGVVGVGAYLNSESKGKNAGDRVGNEESDDGGWWSAVWEWCRIEEDDLSPYRPVLNTHEKLTSSSIYSSVPPVPYDGTHVPRSPHPSSVSEIDKIRAAQLLLHLLPQPAFDTVVYLLAFFSQVVLVEGTNGVGVTDAGGMFGRGVFGDVSRAGRRGERGGSRRASGSAGAGASGEEDASSNGGARMMCWFLRRWDRISNGLFDVPRRLVEERKVEEARTRLRDTATLAPEHDIEFSSTYTYPKDDQTIAQREQGHEIDSGREVKMGITPDVRTIPLPLSTVAQPLERREEPSVERGRRRRVGSDADVAGWRLRNERRTFSRDLHEYSHVEGRTPVETPPQRRDSCVQLDQPRPVPYQPPLHYPGRRPSPSPKTRPIQDVSGSQRFCRSDEDVNEIGQALQARNSSPPSSPQLSMQVESEEWKPRPRRDTEATEATAVESEPEFDSLPTKASVDEMLEDMMHSYKDRGLKPPVMGGSAKTITAGPRSTVLIPAHGEPLAAAVVLPLHVKPKHTAESLLAELRGEVSTESSPTSPRKAEGTSVLITTPVLELRRSDSGTFSVSSTSDLEARLMDVTTDDELRAPFEAGLIIQSRGANAEGQEVTNPTKPYPFERQDTLRALSKDRSPSKRASVYELEAELQQVKEQNKQAMGALQMATRQINSLEAKLQEVGLDDGLQ